MSAHESGKSKPLSRRNFLQTTAAAAAAAVATGGIQSTVKAEDDVWGQKPPRRDKSLPSISYDDGVAAVRQFYEEQKEKLQMPKVAHGIQLMTDKGEKVFMEVLYADEPPPGLPEKLTITINKDNRSIPVVPRKDKMPVPHVRPGYGARHNADGGNGGTAGWNICFNGVPVCLTAYHVLCGVFWNITHSSYYHPPGDVVQLHANGIWNNYARVHDYTEVNFAGLHNTYELAMAKYNNATNDAEAIMRSCSPTFKYDYPSKLFPITSPVVTNLTYHKVGWGASVCGQGRLLSGFGLRGVDYGNNRVAMFDGQLIFSKLADGGDSGAMIVRDDDPLNNPNNLEEKNSVLGVHHTGGNNDSVACPLWNIGWIQQADYTVPGTGNPGRQLPSFAGNFKQVIIQ